MQGSLTEPRAGAPVISAVMPCRNEAAGIEATVRSVLEQDPVPGGFELIVADGSSDDGTRQILDRLARSHPQLRVIENTLKTTPSGMNRGIEAAQGRYIAIMGAHSLYASNYLANCYQVAEARGVDNVGGAVLANATTYMQRAIAASHHSPFSVGGAHWHNAAREGPAESVWGGFYRREVFERIGAFDEELARNQDDELNLRLVRQGGRIWQTPEVVSWYRPRSSLASLFRQYRQYGYWKVRVIQKHRIPASWRHVVPAAAALIAVGLASAAIGSSILCRNRRSGRRANLPARILSAGAAAYLFSDVAASTAAASQAGWDLMPALPLVFPAYHSGYAMGFIEGVVDFVLIRRPRKGKMAELTR